MKKIILPVLAFFVATVAMAQPAQVSTEADGTKIIKGFMTREELATDAAFSWYAQNQKGYVPEQNAVAALKASKDSIHILAFGGTWCDDTKNVLPKFYVLADAAGLSQDHITLLGVDRSKKTMHHLSEAFHVDRVPTFIVLKHGQEIGRVVEYGKYGMFDKELGEIISAKK